MKFIYKTFSIKFEHKLLTMPLWTFLLCVYCMPTKALILVPFLDVFEENKKDLPALKILNLLKILKLIYLD